MGDFEDDPQAGTTEVWFSRRLIIADLKVLFLQTTSVIGLFANFHAVPITLNEVEVPIRIYHFGHLHAVALADGILPSSERVHVITDDAETVIMYNTQMEALCTPNETGPGGRYTAALLLNRSVRSGLYTDMRVPTDPTFPER